jgi:hypothetical protein
MLSYAENSDSVGREQAAKGVELASWKVEFGKGTNPGNSTQKQSFADQMPINNKEYTLISLTMRAKSENGFRASPPKIFIANHRHVDRGTLLAFRQGTNAPRIAGIRKV